MDTTFKGLGSIGNFATTTVGGLASLGLGGGRIDSPHKKRTGKVQIFNLHDIAAARDRVLRALADHDLVYVRSGSLVEKTGQTFRSFTAGSLIAAVSEVCEFLTVLKDGSHKPVKPPGELIAALQSFYIEHPEQWRLKTVVAGTGAQSLNLSLDSFGVPRGTVSNICMILSASESWRAALRFNIMSQTVEKVTPPPWPSDVTDTSGGVGEWLEEDDIRLSVWLEREHGMRATKGDCRDAVRTTSERLGAFHPVREYLNGLPEWDGEERLSSWLTRYLGVTTDEYSARVGSWWLISAIARAYQPGCKVDTMLILEGCQGARKSQALKALCGGVSRNVFGDSEIEWNNKDRFMQIRSCWIYEVAELAGLNKHDSSKLKAFLSSAADRYRAPYGRGEVNIPRSVVFCGSVNPSSDIGYLRDTTGNRRFWPVAVGEVNIASLAQDRDQLWAEALVEYRNGSRWWPETEEEKKLCDIAASARAYSGDPWLDLVRKHILDTIIGDINRAFSDANKVAKKAGLASAHVDITTATKPLTPITIREVLVAIGLPIDKQSPEASARINRCFAELKLTSRLQKIAGTAHRHFAHERESQRRQAVLAVLQSEAKGELKESVYNLIMRPDFNVLPWEDWARHYEDKEKLEERDLMLLVARVLES